MPNVTDQSRTAGPVLVLVQSISYAHRRNSSRIRVSAGSWRSGLVAVFVYGRELGANLVSFRGPETCIVDQGMPPVVTGPD